MNRSKYRTMVEEHLFESSKGHRLCTNYCSCLYSFVIMILCFKCYHMIRLKEQHDVSIKSSIETTLSSSMKTSLSTPPSATIHVHGC